MDEFDFYQGTHTGGEIDQAVDIVENRGEVIAGGDGLVQSTMAFEAIANEIIIIGPQSITGNGSVVGQFLHTYPPMGYAYVPFVTADHIVLRCEFSNPSAITGDWTFITDDNGGIGYSGSLNGTTNITLVLGRRGKNIASGASLNQ